MLKTLAIIGSRSFLGQQLVRRCRAAGIRTVGYRRPPHGGGLPRELTPDVEVDCDLTRPVAAPPEPIDACLFAAQHVAPSTSDCSRSDLFTVNAVGVHRALCMVASNGYVPFLNCSTGTVYAPSTQPLRESDQVRVDDDYALSKLHGESMASLFAETISTTNLRIFGLYGPRQRQRLVPNLVARVRSGESVRLGPNSNCNDGDGGLRVSMLHGADAAAAIIALARRLAMRELTPRLVNLGGSVPVSIRHMAQEIGRLVGHDPIFAEGPARVGDLIADTSLLRSLVPTSPRSWEMGIRQTIEEDQTIGVA